MLPPSSSGLLLTRSLHSLNALKPLKSVMSRMADPNYTAQGLWFEFNAAKQARIEAKKQLSHAPRNESAVARQRRQIVARHTLQENERQLREIEARQSDFDTRTAELMALKAKYLVTTDRTKGSRLLSQAYMLSRGMKTMSEKRDPARQVPVDQLLGSFQNKHGDLSGHRYEKIKANTAQDRVLAKHYKAPFLDPQKANRQMAHRGMAFDRVIGIPNGIKNHEGEVYGKEKTNAPVEHAPSALDSTLREINDSNYDLDAYFRRELTIFQLPAFSETF